MNDICSYLYKQFFVKLTISWWLSPILHIGASKFCIPEKFEKFFHDREKALNKFDEACLFAFNYCCYLFISNIYILLSQMFTMSLIVFEN